MKKALSDFPVHFGCFDVEEDIPSIKNNSHITFGGLAWPESRPFRRGLEHWMFDRRPMDPGETRALDGEQHG